MRSSLLVGGNAGRSLSVGPRSFSAGRRGRVLAVAVGVVCAAGLGPVAVSGTAHAQGSCTGATTTCTFGFTGAEQTLHVPAGVTSVDITAIGAAGATSSSGQGGGAGSSFVTGAAATRTADDAGTNSASITISYTAPPAAPTCANVTPANPQGFTIITGTSRSDILNGTPGPDAIFGLGGNDIINGLGGNDLLCGGDGNDVLSGGDGNDRIEGGNGNDSVNGNAGDDTLHGNAGNDAILGGTGNDHGFGESGNDSLNGQQGTNTNDGGPGNNACLNPGRGQTGATNC